MKVLCRHFGDCGGCAFQDLSADAYRAIKRAQITNTLEHHGVGAVVAPAAEVGAATRRRATWKAEKKDGAVLLGFNAARSHAIVDLHECLVLTPALVALVAGLRELLVHLLRENEQAQIAVIETDTGIDMALGPPARNFTRDVSQLARWAAERNVARITLNGETLVQLANPGTRIGEVDLLLPPGAFLQPSREGEQVLQTVVVEGLRGARRIADLFAGCGTFTLVLAPRASVHAADADAQALQSLQEAVRNAQGLKPVTIECRDLFKRPLRAEELNAFDAVSLDPPRAGARAQVEMIVQSRVGRLAYVSCNPESFARDAAILTRGGFQLTGVKPVDQFLWSKHIELVGAFERQAKWSRRRKS